MTEFIFICYTVSCFLGILVIVLMLCFFRDAFLPKKNKVYNESTRDIMESLDPKERGRVYVKHPHLRKYLVGLEMIDYVEPPEDVSPIDFPEWDIKDGKDIKDLFKDCPAFNQDISNWDVSNVTPYLEMFENMTPEEEMKLRRECPEVMKQVDKDRAEKTIEAFAKAAESFANVPTMNDLFEKEYVGMKIFEKDDRVNFVDSNDVFLGYEIEQHCCESHGWFINDKLLTNHDGGEDTVEQHSDFEGWLFDRNFFLTYDQEKGDDREIMTTAVFRIVKGEEEKYIYIFNEHNGHYAHGFNFKVGKRTVYDDKL